MVWQIYCMVNWFYHNFCNFRHDFCFHFWSYKFWMEWKYDVFWEYKLHSCQSIIFCLLDYFRIQRRPVHWKKILHLKVANIDGKPPQLLGVIISSFGKAFLLPIDMILGLIFTNQKRQRIFNKIGDTVVIKIKNTESDSENIKYKKD